MKLVVTVQGKRASSFTGGRELALMLEQAGRDVEQALDTQAGVDTAQLGQVTGDGWMSGLTVVWEYDP